MRMDRDALYTSPLSFVIHTSANSSRRKMLKLKEPPTLEGRSQEQLRRSISQFGDDESFSEVIQASAAQDTQDFAAGDAAEALHHAKPHAETSEISDVFCSIYDGEREEEEEEERLEEEDEVGLARALSDETVRRKIELLAAMVGVDGAEPLAVLGEVVTVLKALARRAREVVIKAGDRRGAEARLCDEGPGERITLTL